MSNTLPVKITPSSSNGFRFNSQISLGSGKPRVLQINFNVAPEIIRTLSPILIGSILPVDDILIVLLRRPEEIFGAVDSIIQIIRLKVK